MADPYAPAVANHDQVSNLGEGHDSICPEHVAGFADRSHDITCDPRCGSGRRQFNSMKRPVQCRPNQLAHPGVDDYEILIGTPWLDVDDRGNEHTGRTDHPSSRLDHDRQSGTTNGLNDSLGVRGGRGGRGSRRTKCRAHRLH